VGTNYPATSSSNCQKLGTLEESITTFHKLSGIIDGGFIYSSERRKREHMQYTFSCLQRCCIVVAVVISAGKMLKIPEKFVVQTTGYLNLWDVRVLWCIYIHAALYGMG